MSDAESELERLASGVAWRMDNVPWMKSTLQTNRDKVLKVRDAIRNGDWESHSADVAEAHLTALEATLLNARNWLDRLESLPPKHAQLIQEQAQEELENLPMGGLPTAVRDAIDKGQPEALTPYGLIAVGTGPIGAAIASEFFESKRRDAAVAALARIEASVAIHREELNSAGRRFDEVEPTIPPPPPPEPPIPGGDGSDGLDSNFGGSGSNGGTPGGRSPNVGGPGGGTGGVIGGPDGQGPSVTDDPPGTRDPNVIGDPGPRDPNWPTVVTDPPPYDPNRPDGPGGNSGVDPEWNDPGRRPSVDSNLDGSTLRSGLGAAGLGAAGLAAGAKLAGAGGSGGALGLGGVGQGAFGAGAGGAGLSGGGGLRGAASAASTGGAGGAGAGSSNSNGGARAGRGGMMMGGGGGGGAAEKKSARSGLGYIAPKLEDEGDGGPAARASRAGGRLPEE